MASLVAGKSPKVNRYQNVSHNAQILIIYLGSLGKRIAQAISRGPDGSVRPSLATLALMQHWTDPSAGAQLPARKRASLVRQELLTKYNQHRLAQTPPLRRMKEWPAAALALGCPVKVENWPENCTFNPLLCILYSSSLKSSFL